MSRRAADPALRISENGSLLAETARKVAPVALFESFVDLYQTDEIREACRLLGGIAPRGNRSAVLDHLRSLVSR